LANKPQRTPAEDGQPENPKDGDAETVPAAGTGSIDPATSHSGGQNDLFREISLVWIAVHLINAAPRRIRRALEKQIADVTRSIETYGFRIPILVRTTANGERHQVVDGHVRLEAAKRLGAEAIQCIVVDDLPDVQVRRLSLSLNKLQETGAWDADAVRLEISELIEITGNLEIPGFGMPEIEAIRFGQENAEEPDPADDLSAMPRERSAISQSGDLWILSEHRLFCGSARDAESISAILGGETAAACFTDPPYNVKVNGHVRSEEGGYREFAEASGEMSPPEFTGFLTETLGAVAASLRPGGIVFVCMDWRHVGEMSEALDALGLDLLNICIWVKSNPGMGSLYRSQYEHVFVARMPGGSHQNNVQLGRHGRNRSNVWHYAGATGGRADPDDDFGAHPTVKPIRMVMDALLDVTSPGDLVLDPFLGSGTTLLAAERTRRRCVGVETDPVYVDLTIRRWQAMTGGQAVHADTGQSFDAFEAAGARCGDPDAASTKMEDF